MSAVKGFEGDLAVLGDELAELEERFLFITNLWWESCGVSVDVWCNREKTGSRRRGAETLPKPCRRGMLYSKALTQAHNRVEEEHAPISVFGNSGR